jgi:DNA repair protein RecO (recombination protein O)
MRTYSATGIVLRRIDLGEKDRILTVYTKEYGKLGAVAKGARRPGSKLAAASEPFTYSKMLLATGRDLDVLSQAEIRESFPNVRAAMTSIAYGVYILELTNHFVDDRQANAELFDTLLSAMYVLESGTDAEIAARRFELDVLTILGYEPHVEACVVCGGEIGLGKVGFSRSLGGIACASCVASLHDTIPLSGAVVSYVHALRKAEPRDLGKMKIPRGARRDLAHMLREHIRYRLEREIKSTDFIRAAEALETK